MTKVIVLSGAANITSKEFTALETTITNVVYYNLGTAPYTFTLKLIAQNVYRIRGGGRSPAE